MGVLLRNVSRFLGYHDDQLEEKKTELQKYSKELEATENTIERCKKTLKEFEIELGKLKACIKKTKDPQPTGTVNAPRKPLHQVSFSSYLQQCNIHVLGHSTESCPWFASLFPSTSKTSPYTVWISNFVFNV